MDETRRLHRMTLDGSSPEFKIDNLTEDEKKRLQQRVAPFAAWPDSVAGLTRLKKRYISVAAFERQRVAAHRDGEVRGAAVGLHPGVRPWRGTTSPTKRCI